MESVSEVYVHENSLINFLQCDPYWDDVPILSLFDMSRAGAISSTFSNLVKHEVPLRRRDMITAMLVPMNKISNFWTMMTSTRSVLTGSTALLFWRGLHAFKPKDFDICTPSANHIEVVQWFTDEMGFQRVSEDDQEYNDIGPEITGIERIVRLRSGSTVVDIIVSRGSSALLPITDFWSTSLRNYVTADGACCAYPLQLRLNMGLISQTQRIRDDDITERLVQKYEDRGIMNVQSIDRWANLLGGGCDDQWVCPLEWRTFGDKGSAVCWFRPDANIERDAALLMCEIPVLWRLGGEACLPQIRGSFMVDPDCRNDGRYDSMMFEISPALRGEAEEWCESREHTEYRGRLKCRPVSSYL
jgi:hypothetical protein